MTDLEEAGEVDEATPRQPGPVIAAVAVLVLVALLVVVLVNSEPAANRLAESPLLGQPAPPVAGRTMDGDEIDLTGPQGQFVLVNFFASWCGPCQLEHDDLAAFWDRYEQSGEATLVSVVFDDTTEAATGYFEENGGDWPLIVGDDGGIALDYGVLKLPETFVIGPDGTVLARFAGEVTIDGLEDVLARLRGLDG